MIASTRAEQVEAITLIKNRKKLIDAVLQKNRSLVRLAMFMARNIDTRLAMTDPRAYRKLTIGASNMMLSGF